MVKSYKIDIFIYYYKPHLTILYDNNKLREISAKTLNRNTK